MTLPVETPDLVLVEEPAFDCELRHPPVCTKRATLACTCRGCRRTQLICAPCLADIRQWFGEAAAIHGAERVKMLCTWCRFGGPQSEWTFDRVWEVTEL